MEQVVNININPHETSDIYINDLVQATIHIEGSDNVSWGECAILLAINCCAHPKDPHEPIPREDMEARNKLIAEVAVEKQKITL